MIPSALSGQLQQGLADFLRFSFWSSTPGMEHVISDLIDEPGGLLKGPYVSLKLPFVSGKHPNFFPNVPMGFTPHFHQEQAFTRLSGRRKQSTLVATGTGSGKTECFLLPILDHCLADAANKGVKAILIYPMNALATDQAARIAKMIHGNDKLRGKVTAGLYIGEDRGSNAKTERKMGPKTVITDRAVMKESPPDILLTNYKMLDYLLLRPGDQGVWQHNSPRTLRYLVVDEIHTFDGAQGTDLACLIRRLKRRLQVDDGTLCCVGTSATLGGEGAGQVLTEYAEQVFGEPLDLHAVISESRLNEQQYFKGSGVEWTDEPELAELDRLDPAHSTDPEAWIRDQTELWFGDVHAGEGDTWAVELGERLKRHAVFQNLLKNLNGQTVDVGRLSAEMARSRGDWRDHPEFGRLAIMSLIGLVSAARAYRAELPEVARSREESRKPRPVQPFLDVRIQLWQRELRRMVGSLEDRPKLRHSMDLDKETRKRHLPLIHCRECGGMGWATLIHRDTPNRVSTELDSLYRAFFSDDAQVDFLFPAAAIPEKDPTWSRPPFTLDVESMTKMEDGETPDGPTVKLVPSYNTRSTSKGPQLSKDCPFCMARDALALIGFRAATLTSVYIDQLYASPFNDDKKLLTFSDSVQDAAHRAGFFGARTWRTNLRIAMLHAIRKSGGLTLAELSQTVGQVWQDRLDMPTWVSTFLAPSMTWLHDWETLKADGELPEDSNLQRLVSERLAFEVTTEFGMQSGIGRSLMRTGTAAVAIDESKLNQAVTALMEPMQNEVPGLRDVTEKQVQDFVVGVLTHLRSRGGILPGTLPDAYVETLGKDVHSFQRAHALPAFSRSSRLPAMLTDHTRSSRFDSWGGTGIGNWYNRWVARCFGSGDALTADPSSAYPVVLAGLTDAGLLTERVGSKEESIWGVQEEALWVSEQVARIQCNSCGHAHHIAEQASARWQDTPCLTARCGGRYHQAEPYAGDYFSRLYSEGDLERIFTEEHTGLLNRAEREQVEFEFKAPPGDPDDPAARKPWYANLLSCTPTLEMGIDIGDLSSTILCSVPPTQSNYLQRIGRAGRQDGNAFVLTVAGGRPHDLYFFSEPAEMFAGSVTPPGVFLNAPAVLERQLTAFCFDRWVATAGDAAELPAQLRTVFGHLDEKESAHFPFNLLAFIESQQPTLLREFGEMFADEISSDTMDHLSQYMMGTDDGQAGLRWNILEAIQRERKQQQSLSAKAQTLRKEIKRLQEMEAKSKDHQEELDQLDQEKGALLKLVAGINRRHTLEFLTEEGLLPNYAFPESAVSLKSVIWRKKKKVPESGSKYDYIEHEYKRSPASALSDLAPDASFYAGGRKVKIDQIDVAVSQPENWRFCAECNHGQCVDTGDEVQVCPSCNSQSWCDDGQRFRLMKLQQVFAKAPDRTSRIRDDSDERNPKFFQRSVTVDIHDEHRAGAWHTESDRNPFGFEFLTRATFREINFGEPSDQGPPSLVAGREAVRPGFHLCARCGMVQQPRKEPIHALSCPSRKKGAKSEFEDCLYLYREFQSEALRMLLPMTDLGTQRQLHSFVAALQVGLRERFQGSVEHLRTTVYSDPIEGTALRKQFLVLYDTVPGGTGYLKQLVTPEADEGRMPLYEVLEAARDRVEGCSCWNDPTRDGCYRCLYAFRNARDMDDTSSQTASDLLRTLLADEENLTEIDSIGNVSVTSLMDSVLELRFIEALRLIKSPDGKQAKVEHKLVNQKTGYHWTLDDKTWVIEPQVNPPASKTAGVGVSIDFVMRPAHAQSERKLAILLDGWAYHKDRVGKDLHQRMALLASGGWDVWTFTWDDLNEKFGTGNTELPIEFAVPSPPRLKDVLQRMKLPAHAHLGNRSTFGLFESELQSDGLPWKQIAKGVVASRVKPAQGAHAAAWTALVEKVSPEHAKTMLSAMNPQFAFADVGDSHKLVEWMAISVGQEPALICWLNDDPSLYETPEYKAAWRGVLRLFQWLRHTPNSWFVTQSALETRDYSTLFTTRYAMPAEDGWVELKEIEDDFQNLAGTLIEAGVPEPEIGLDIPDARDEAWAQAEMVWADAKVAVTSKEWIEGARGEPAQGWTVLLLDELGESVEPVLAALRQSEED